MELNTIGLGLQKTNGQKNKAEQPTVSFMQVQLEVAAIKSSSYPSFGSGLLLSNELHLSEFSPGGVFTSLHSEI